MMRLPFVVLAGLLIAAIQAPTRDGPAPQITAVGGPTVGGTTLRAGRVPDRADQCGHARLLPVRTRRRLHRSPGHQRGCRDHRPRRSRRPRAGLLPHALRDRRGGRRARGARRGRAQRLAGALHAGGDRTPLARRAGARCWRRDPIGGRPVRRRGVGSARLPARQRRRPAVPALRQRRRLPADRRGPPVGAAGTATRALLRRRLRGRCRQRREPDPHLGSERQLQPVDRRRRSGVDADVVAVQPGPGASTSSSATTASGRRASRPRPPPPPATPSGSRCGRRRATC